MMKRRILGLDINDEYVAAAVVESRGQERVVTGSGSARFDKRDDLAQVLPPLLEQVGWKGGTCICGVSLSEISLRNLIVPFTEKRKIAQILPLELEDQLLRPAHDQIIEYSITGAEGNQSHLLVASLEKDLLRRDLALLDASGLKPATVTLRSFALAEQFLRVQDFAGGFLLIDAGLHAVTIAVAGNGQVAFARRLAYPDRVFTERPFIVDEEGPRIVHHEEAMASIASLCDSIKRSTGLYMLENGVASLPEEILLSGAMARVEAFREKLEAEFDRAVYVGDLQQQAGVTLQDDVRSGWDPGFADHALALALQGFGKKVTFNFCKDEFAPPKLLFASKPQLIAASVLLAFLLAGTVAYLGYDYRTLNARYTELDGRMTRLFKETFPETTRIVDPLVQMKSKLQDVQAPSIATPIFSGDKRALNILADISGRVPESIEIHVSRLVIETDSVVIRGTTDAFNNVNLIQGVLRKSPAYSDVAIVSASAEKDSGLIRFELKLRAAGTS